MALIFAESFRGYANENQMAGEWSVLVWAGNTAFYAPSNPPNSRAIRVPTSGSSRLDIRRNVPAGKQFQAHIYLGGVGSTSLWAHALTFRDSGGSILASLQLNRTDGGLRFLRGGTVIATGGITFSDNDQMALVEVRLELENGSGGSVVVKVNGVEEMNFSGQTSPSANDCEVIGLGGDQTNQGILLTRPVLMDWSGTRLNDFTGPMAEIPLPLIADGSVTDMTPDTGTDHYPRVNEAVADGDTSYVRTETEGDVDLYEAKPGSFPDDSDVAFVRQVLITRNEAAGTSHYALLVKPDAGEPAEKSPSFLNTQEVYTSRAHLWPLNPVTNAEWTRAQILAGIEVGQSHEAEP
jgi:hypothetical protein